MHPRDVPVASASAVERIITGSNIRRVATETPSTVLSLSAADIARSGLTISDWTPFGG